MRKTVLVLLIAFLASACGAAPSTAPVPAVKQVAEQATNAPSVTATQPGPTSTTVRSTTPQPVATDSPPNTLKPAPTNTPRPTATDTQAPASTNTRLPVSPDTAGVEAQVIKVVDGDTIDVSIGGKTYAVRYIGMDTPEDTTRHEPGGPEATAKNRELVQGRKVRLEKDVSETDRYGRLLRYVYVGDVMANAELVRQGYAQAATFPPDVKYQDLFLTLQQEAREAGRGLWGAVPPTSAARAPQQPVPTPTAASGDACDRCIKGNIGSTGEKIYHFPGCKDYDKTVITESKGERWFSSEAEAKAAGWRRALNCP